MEWFLTIIGFSFVFLFTVLLIASRYKRCPSDKILVVYGKVGEGQSARHPMSGPMKVPDSHTLFRGGSA